MGLLGRARGTTRGAVLRTWSTKELATGSTRGTKMRTVVVHDSPVRIHPALGDAFKLVDDGAKYLVSLVLRVVPAMLVSERLLLG